MDLIVVLIVGLSLYFQTPPHTPRWSSAVRGHVTHPWTISIIAGSDFFFFSFFFFPVLFSVFYVSISRYLSIFLFPVASCVPMVGWLRPRATPTRACLQGCEREGRTRGGAAGGGESREAGFWFGGGLSQSEPSQTVQYSDVLSRPTCLLPWLASQANSQTDTDTDERTRSRHSVRHPTCWEIFSKTVARGNMWLKFSNRHLEHHPAAATSAT